MEEPNLSYVRLNRGREGEHVYPNIVKDLALQWNNVRNAELIPEELQNNNQVNSTPSSSGPSTSRQEPKRVNRPNQPNGERWKDTLRRKLREAGLEFDFQKKGELP